MDIATLKPGDLVEINGETRIVGRITEPYPNRFVVRLDAKFEPSIELNILNK